MIIDEVTIFVKAGSGGAGNESPLVMSARRTIGGGGNGGKGGDCIIKVSPHLYDLSKVVDRHRYIACGGERGDRNNRKGKDGRPIYIYVPKGTLGFDPAGNLLFDLDQDGQEFLICRGGKAGEGNFHKMYTLPPEPGEEKEVILDFRAGVEAAVVGFANSGKTSLVNVLTGQNFKVAEYPHTTRFCAWARPAGWDFSLMDTPALKRDCSDPEKDLWFLKHLYRTDVVVLVSDDPVDCRNDFNALIAEILRLDEELLAGKKILRVLTKADRVKKVPRIKDLIKVSATTGSGLKKLQDEISAAVHAAQYDVKDEA